MGILKKFLKYWIKLYKIYKSPWKGNYLSWSEALKKTSSYNNKEVFEKVRLATLNVKNDVYPYERDSVNFDKIEYSYPLIVGLLSAIGQNREMKVCDFGGALGSAYFQNINILKNVSEIKLIWCVVEQEEFVRIGNKEIADKNLFFHLTIDDFIKEWGKPDIILLSSVLPYIENPYKILEDIKNIRAKYIFIDRTYFFENNNDRITIQKVPKEIYSANYPSWILNYNKVLDFLNEEYEILLEFDSFVPLEIYFKDEIAKSKGILCKIKENIK